MLYSPLKVNRSFEGKYRLHLQDQVKSHARKESQAANKARANGGNHRSENLKSYGNKLAGMERL
jgi:hypothetical protein